MKPLFRPIQIETVDPLGIARGEAKPFQMVFSEAVTVGLTSVLGPSGARAAFYHLGLAVSADARKVHEGLAKFFGAGTQALEASILRELYSRLGMNFEPEESMTFTSFVAEARRIHSRRTGGSI